MMTIFSLMVSVFVFLILYGFIKEKKGDKQIKERLWGLTESGETQSVASMWRTEEEPKHEKAQRMEDKTFMDRVLIPAKNYITQHLLAMTPKSIHDYISHQLVLAGKSGRGQVGLLLFRIALFALIFGAGMFYAISTSDKAPVQKLAYLIMGVLIGGFLPISALRRQISNRQDNIRRHLPEMLDLLSVSVEAGLSFDAAMRKIVERMKGPFVDECKKMLDDVRMGDTRRRALQNLAKRCEVQEVSLFVTSVIQAERLGSNMSNTLKIQADNVRERHRQWVKAMALKAPVKIVLPLVGLILPAIFIVALGPAIANIMKNFIK